MTNELLSAFVSCFRQLQQFLDDSSIMI